MENLEELNQLFKKKKDIEDCIKDCKSIKYADGYVGISTEYERITKGMNDIKCAIGKEKLKELVMLFSGLISSELYQLREKNEAELQKYQVVKNE